LLTFDDARRHGKQMVAVTESRYMPPWLPLPGHGEFRDSLRLRDDEIALLAQWVREGMPEGNPADLPAPPRFTGGWQLGPPDLVLKMTARYELAATGGDVFRNFVLPLDLKETKYIRAFELRPGNKRVVHHANLIVDRSGLLRRRDGADGRPGFGGMDVETEVSGEFDPDSHFLFWKPGTQAQQQPDSMAWRLDPGSDLIVNLHLQPSGKPEPVDAEVGLYFTPHAPTQHPMLLQLEHDGAINLAPGDAAAEVSDHLTLPSAVKLLAVYPHAHYLGKEIEAWAELPDGKRLPLLKIDRWDINWQATYTYREPVSLPAGTTLAMRIRYDNSEANPRNPNHPPIRVVSGNRSEDEMGHVWFQVLPEAQGEGDPRLLLQEASMRRRIEKYPADFVAHFNLGAALEAEDRAEEALPYLVEAVKIRPANATARNNLAVALFAAGKTEDAAREFREALALDPGYRNARYNLARTLAQSGDTAGAIRELREHLKSAPEDAEAQELMGRLLAASGQLHDALPWFRRAAELDPANSGYLANLGVALASTGDAAGAIPLFEKALQADPDNAAIRGNLERARHAAQGARP
jgi:tetratricopeptide (TPR) repeat protein